MAELIAVEACESSMWLVAGDIRGGINGISNDATDKPAKRVS